MKKSGICPKCSNKNIYKMNEEISGYAGWFIPLSKNLTTKSTRAKMTIYICEKCGFIEHYLDDVQLDKVKNILEIKTN